MDVKIINLSQAEKKPIMLEETRFICIGKELCDANSGMGIFFKRFLNKYQHIEKTVLLNIENISIDSNLVINNTKKLFTIFHDVDKTLQSEFPLKIKLSRLKEPFFLLFNTKEVIDCRNSQDNTTQLFNIEYSLVLRDEKGEVINNNDTDAKEVLSIQFAREQNVPKVVVFLDCPNIQYRSRAGLQKIGTLNIQLPNTLQYAPSVDLKIDLRVVDSAGNAVNDFLTLEKEKERYTNVNETKLRAKTLANGKPTAVVRYELYVDLDKIANPMEAIANYTIVGDAKFKYSCDNTYLPFIDIAETISVMKDKQSTELVVSAFRDAEYLKRQNNTWNVPQINFTASVLVYPVKFAVGNKATDSSRANAGLWVSNLRIHSVLNEGYTLYNKNQELIPVNRIVI